MKNFSVQRTPYDGTRLQKITNRPILASYGKSNHENAQAEFRSQEQILEQKRLNFAEFEKIQMEKLHGTAEVKQHYMQNYHAELEANQRAQNELLVQKKLEEMNLEKQILEKIKYEQIMEQEKEQALKEYQEYLRMVQQNDIQLKKRNQEQLREEEVKEDKQRPEFFKGHFGKSVR